MICVHGDRDPCDRDPFTSVRPDDIFAVTELPPRFLDVQPEGSGIRRLLPLRRDLLRLLLCLGPWTHAGTVAGVGAGVGAVGTGGAVPSDIAGLSGWWDAGTAPASGFGSIVDSLPDKSGGGRPLIVGSAVRNGIIGGGGTPLGCIATPRLCGLLGGLRSALVHGSQVPTVRPWINPITAYKVSAVQMGAGHDWTFYLVWSRPNLAQGDFTGSPVPGPQVLLAIDNTTIVGIGNTGTGDTLTLFPGSVAPAALRATLTRRHTHSLVIRNTVGAGVDVWLDDALVAKDVPHPLAGSLRGTLFMLGGGVTSTTSQCDFHECALWGRSLDPASMALLVTGAASVTKRWPRGNRSGYAVITIGQSNAGQFKIYGLPASGETLMTESLRYYLGALCVYPLGMQGPAKAGGVDAGGTALYGSSGPEWLQDVGGPISGWPRGLMGTNFALFANSLPAYVRDDIAAIYIHWSENDSLRGLAEKAKYRAALQRVIALVRSDLGKSAARLPVFCISALPYGPPTGALAGSPGAQMIREAVAETVAGDLNVFLGLPQSADVLPGGATYRPDGTWSGGDGGHMDAEDDRIYGRRVAPVMAARLVAAGAGESIRTVPKGVPRAGGPTISQAVLESPASIMVTVTHDAGNDLRVPLLAKTGAGWAVVDGTAASVPRPVIGVSACVRVDATHLRLTLASAMSPDGMATPAQCSLYYPYGVTKIGRGNAITDNCTAVAKPPGWDIAADMGPTWAIDFPLQATMHGVPLSRRAKPL